MQSKVKRLSTLAYASFTWLLGVSREREREPFLFCENMPQHRFLNRLYYAPAGALHCKHLRIANVRETDTRTHLYGISHMSSVEPVSRKRVRLVGATSSGHCRNTK